MGKAFAVFLACLLMAGPAFAAGIDITKIPKPAVYEFPPASVFEKSTKPVREDSPFGDEHLSYELRLPDGWTDNAERAAGKPIAGKSTLSANVPDILGRYISPAKNFERSTITVEAQSLSYEISAQNWFVHFILSSGYSLTALQEISAQEAVALYVHVDKDKTYAVRARILIDGSRLVLVRYYLPQENYDDEKVAQAQIMASFRLTHPTKERIEKQEQYDFLDQSYVNFPASWTLKEKSILSIERMSATLYQETVIDKQSVLDGQIKIDVISKLLKTTMAQEVAKWRKAFVIKDYTVGALIENVTYQYAPSVKSGKSQIYKLVPDDPVNMKPYELMVTVMEGHDYYYITSMITPSRNEDFYGWARNMEAARVINQSLRRNNAPPDAKADDPYYNYLKE